MKKILYNLIPIYVLVIISFFTVSFFVDIKPREKVIPPKVEHNLVGYWRFDEQVGNTITDKQNKYGTTDISHLYNNAVFTYSTDPTWRESGVVGGSLLFDGFTTHFKYEKHEIPVDDMTISVWVAPRAFPFGYEGKLSSFISSYNMELNDKNHYEFSEGFDFGMFRHGSWSFKVKLTNETGDKQEYLEIWDNSHTLEKFEWNYLVATYNSTTGRLAIYRNGELANEVFANEKGLKIKPSINDLFIGKNANSYYEAGNDTNAYMGLMDELKIFNKSLSDKDVLNKYNEYLLGNESIHPEVVTNDLMWDDTALLGDRYRPQFHAVPVQSWMNEPHAPIYYNGKYHFFYQFNPFGPYFGQHHWGHWVSDDMVRWEHVKPALAPFLNDNGFSKDGMWSGSATYDENGRPVLVYTAGNFSVFPSQSIGLALPHDLSDPYLQDWDIYPNPVLSMNLPNGWRHGDFRDPFVWKNENENRWNMIITTGYYDQGLGRDRGTAAVYTSTDLKNWEFKGPIMDPHVYNHPGLLGTDWELTVMLPLKNKDGEHVKDIFLFLPHGGGSRIEVYYFLGQYDENTYRFIPEHKDARKLDFGDGIFTGPSGFVDPKTGRSILFTIAQGDRDAAANFASGWAHNAGMPISLYVDDLGNLRFDPIEEFESIRTNELLKLTDINNIGYDEIQSLNTTLQDIKGDLLEVKMTIKSTSANEVYLKLRKSADSQEETLVGYDFVLNEMFVDISKSSLESRGHLSTPRSQGNVTLNSDGTITLHMYLDRSILEVYGNSQLSISKRIYPTLADSLGLEIYADGFFDIKSLEIYELGSVYGETIPSYYGN